MTRMIQLLAILLALPLLAGCTSSIRYKLMPVGEGIRWHHGLAVLPAAEGDVKAAVAFIGSERGNTLFNVIVENRGDADILVAPEEFHYDVIVLAGSARGTTRTASFPDRQPVRVMALDPEIELGHAAQLYTANQSTSFIDVLSSIGNLLEDEPETEAEIAERNLEELKELRRQKEKSERGLRLQQERIFWRDSALRKTTLAPNQTIAGVVAFSGRPPPERLYLVLPLGEVTLEFEFQPSKP